MTATACVLGVLASANVLRQFGPTGTGLVLGPAVAIGLVMMGRRLGLSWGDLGLARGTLARGVAYAGGAIAVVVVGYVACASLPLTRSVFLDSRYHMSGSAALLKALVIIPLGTVLLEEVAFRGVLQGLVTRYRGVRWGLAFSSAVFGAWHVLPSLGLSRANATVGNIAGHGLDARAGVIVAVVLATAVAGLVLGELRRRSGSL